MLLTMRWRKLSSFKDLVAFLYRYNLFQKCCKVDNSRRIIEKNDNDRREKRSGNDNNKFIAILTVLCNLEQRKNCFGFDEKWEKEKLSNMKEKIRRIMSGERNSNFITGHCLLHDFISFNDDTTFLDSVKFLLDIDKNLLYEKDQNGYIPLHIACQKSASIEVMKLLLKYDVDNPHKKEGRTTVLEVDNHKNRRLPLHIACREENTSVEMIELLLKYDHFNQAIFQKDIHDQLPLHYACANKNNKNASRIIELLLNQDYNEKRTLYEKENISQMLPLHIACQKNNASSVEIINILLQNDSENRTIFERDRSNMLPLHRACQFNASMDVIELLLKYDDEKKTIKEKDFYGRTPFHLACKFNKSAETQKLLLYWQTMMMMMNISHIPFYRLKIDAFLNEIYWSKRNCKYSMYDMKAKKFTSYCHLIESTTLLELALLKNNYSFGIEVIMNRTLEFLME